MKKIATSFFFLFISMGILHAIEIMSVFQRGDSVITVDINKIDSIVFPVSNSNKGSSINSNASEVQYTMQINQKMNSMTKIDLLKIDSTLFEETRISDKRGFVIFRVDDTQSSSEMDAMSKVFDKYGFKMNNIFNINTTADIRKTMLDYQARGHEIGDHTPHHSTGYADLATDKQVKSFVGLPGVEKIIGKRVYFKWTYPELKDCAVNGKTITVTAGSSTVTGNLSTVNAPSDVIYTSEYGWVHLINKTDSQATAINIRAYWSNENLVFTSNSTEQLYKTPIYGVFLDADATSALLLSSRVLFDDYGFMRPHFWAMQGNYLAVVRAETMKEVGPKYGYVGSICSNSLGATVAMNYNQSDSVGRWAENGITFYVENITALEAEKHISNMVAKHQVAIDCGHFWYKNATLCPQFTGTDAEKFQQYLSRLDSVLHFCYDNKIAVLTHEQAINVLYDQVQDSTSNMMPPLYNDLTAQGYPDGYTLDSKTVLVDTLGVPEDQGFSLKKTGNGTIFKISSIGGFEKGSNTFSFYAKGIDNAVLTISIKSVNEGVTYQSIKIPILSASNSFAKFESKINIPYDKDLFTLDVSVARNDGSDFYISGMDIGKNPQ
jgi:hypothetical protein